jgi:hypothetical protein
MALCAKRRVLVATFLAVVLTALAIVACSTFDASPDSPDGSTPDAAAPEAAANDSAPVVPDAGVDAARVPCSARKDLLLCDEFETLDGWSPTADGGSLAVAPNPIGTGTALKAEIQAGRPEPRAFLYKGFPIGEVYVRLFVLLQKAFVETDAPYPFIVVGGVELDFIQGKIALNQYAAPAFFQSASTKFPIGQWACIEWKLTIADSTVWVDGKVAVSETSRTFAANGTEIELGLNYNGTTTANEAILIDGLAIGRAAIGCN